MYVCSYVCMYVCMHVCMYVCMYVCTCMYVCMYVYMYVCMYLHVCIYVYMYVCVYVCVCVCVCFVGVPIVSGESGYRGSLNVLAHSPATNKHCRQTCLCLLDDGSALRVSNHRFLLPTSHNWLNFIKPQY